VESKRQLGYIGLGLMGGGMATHLVKRGYPVTVFDLRPEAIEAVMEFGAERGESPKAVAASSEVVITSLPNPAIVEQVALGPDGIVEGIRPGAVYIDMSTIEPNTTRKVAAEIEKRGAHMLDVPVGKGPAAAASGDLTLMVGGDPKVVESVADVLDTLGSNRFSCGPIGMGITTKLVNNLVSCAINVLVGEAMAIGARAGLDPQVMYQVMSNTAADNWHLRGSFPSRVFPGDFSPNFKLVLAHKDLALATGLASSLGVPSLIGTAAHQLHTLALGAGLGDEDQTACIKVLEACTGAPVRTPQPDPTTSSR
jgi:3-hydroxyisobutyrate dehydrogenase-like beta-hydroxyacid dehydrogenase